MKIYNGNLSKKFPKDIQVRSLIKLRMIDGSKCLEDLKNPPGNRLEYLKGVKQDLLSIRINDQWRICFRWEQNEAIDVEICDYH